MNKKNLSEADIKAKYITPAIIKAGWYDPLIEKEDKLLDDVNRETLEATEKYYWS